MPLPLEFEEEKKGEEGKMGEKRGNWEGEISNLIFWIPTLKKTLFSLNLSLY